MSAGRGDTPIVDTHVHVWPRGLVHPVQRDRVPLRATPADLIETLDENGVDAAFVCPAMVYVDNGYVLGSAATLPHRILAVVSIDPRDRSAVDSIPTLAANGAAGARINLLATPLDSPADMAGLDALADVASAAGLVLQWTVPLPSTSLIERAAARAPKLRHVLDHLGLPSDPSDLRALDRMRALAAIPGLSVKLSEMYALSKAEYPYEDTWAWVAGVVEAFGPDRMTWGSDWPLVTEYGSYSRQLELVHRLPFLDATSRRMILHDTAIRVWSRL